MLDIKPYVAAYDSVPTATMAPWVEQKAASDSALHGAIESVQFSEQAREQLGEQLGHMRFYSSVESAEELPAEDIDLVALLLPTRSREQLVDIPTADLRVIAANPTCDPPRLNPGFASLRLEGPPWLRAYGEALSSGVWRLSWRN